MGFETWATYKFNNSIYYLLSTLILLNLQNIPQNFLLYYILFYEIFIWFIPNYDKLYFLED